MQYPASRKLPSLFAWRIDETLAVLYQPMRTRIGIAMSLYWAGIVQLIDVIALISALGAIGSLPALLSALTKYARLALGRLLGGGRAPHRHPSALLGVMRRDCRASGILNHTFAHLCESARPR
jgi:hypothetical protein